MSEALSLTPPAHPARAARAPTRLELAPRPARPAVLVVEANPARRATCVRGLRRLTGMEVVGLESCAEARAHTADGPPALVVADLDLADDDRSRHDLETLARLRAPVLLLTARPGRFEGVVTDSAVELMERVPLVDLRDHVLRTLESRLWQGLYARHGAPDDADDAPAALASRANTIELLLDEILAAQQDTPPAPAVDDFDALMERAFDALLANDRATAWSALQAARALRPDHRLVKANLARLDALGLS